MDRILSVRAVAWVGVMVSLLVVPWTAASAGSAAQSHQDSPAACDEETRGSDDRSLA